MGTLTQISKSERRMAYDHWTRNSTCVFLVLTQRGRDSAQAMQVEDQGSPSSTSMMSSTILFKISNLSNCVTIEPK